MKKVLAFTLIEIMFVMLIVGILTAMSIANYKNYVCSLASSNSAEQIAMDLQYQRTQTIATEEKWGMRFTSSGVYVLYNQDTSEIVKTVDLSRIYSSNVVLQFLGGATCIYFDPRVKISSGDKWAFATPMTGGDTTWNGGNIIMVTSGQFTNFVKLSRDGQITVTKT